MSDDDRSRWNARYEGRALDELTAAPTAFLVELDRDRRLPPVGRALDVAGGTGRHAIWLAARGWDVTLVDVSDTGVELAQARASRVGVSIEVERLDLERDELPIGPFDLVVCANYLQRSLFGRLAARLAPGGMLVVRHPTVTNLERNARPSRRFLLDRSELADLIHNADPEGALTIEHSSEDWSTKGVHEARLAAVRKPAGAAPR